MDIKAANKYADIYAVLKMAHGEKLLQAGFVQNRYPNP